MPEGLEGEQKLISSRYFSFVISLSTQLIDRSEFGGIPVAEADDV